MKKILLIMLFAIASVFAQFNNPAITHMLLYPAKHHTAKKADTVKVDTVKKTPIKIDSNYTVTFDSTFGYTPKDSLEQALIYQWNKYGFIMTPQDRALGLEIMRELNHIDNQLKKLDTLQFDMNKIKKMLHISNDSI